MKIMMMACPLLERTADSHSRSPLEDVIPRRRMSVATLEEARRAVAACEADVTATGRPADIDVVARRARGERAIAGFDRAFGRPVHVDEDAIGAG